jgi:hypothetical protein
MQSTLRIQADLSQCRPNVGSLTIGRCFQRSYVTLSVVNWSFERFQALRTPKPAFLIHRDRWVFRPGALNCRSSITITVAPMDIKQTGSSELETGQRAEQRRIVAQGIYGEPTSWYAPHFGLPVELLIRWIRKLRSMKIPPAEICAQYPRGREFLSRDPVNARQFSR